MKPAILCLMALSAVALAQRAAIYHDSNLSVWSNGLLVTQGDKGLLHFDLQGGVRIASKDQGVSLSAARVLADTVPVKGTLKMKKTQVKSATATTGVVIEQLAGGQGNKRTTIRANKAVYTAQGDKGLVTLTGAVKIVSVDAKDQTLTASGTSGIATLDPKAESSQGLRTATLRGPVTVTIQEVGRKGQIVAKGDRLDVNRSLKPTTLTLTGHVTIQGQGESSMGTLAVKRAVFTLNDKGEFQTFRAETDG
jgi:hypothetical protein